MKSNTLSMALALLLVLALCLCLLPAAFAEELNVSDSEAFDASITVTLYANDGSGTELGKVSGAEGDKRTLTEYEGYTRSGYNFAGWNSEPDGSGTSYGDVNNPYGAEYTFHRGETALYAQWASVITVKFDANGGTPASIPNIVGSQGAIRTLYTDSEIGLRRTRENGREYRFTGWNFNKEGTKYDEGVHLEPGAVVILNADATVYAEWEKPVTVKYMANGGSGYIEPDDTHFSGDTIYLAGSASFTKDGYTFIGWNTDRYGNGISYSDRELVYLTDDLTLYAQWAREVIVTFISNFQEGGADDQISYQRLPVKIPSALEKNVFDKPNYRFVGWNTMPDGSGTSYKNGDIVLLDRNITLYAQWEQSAFTVNFYDGDALIQTILVPKSDVIELIDYDMTSAGKVLIGWSLVKGRDVAAYKPGQGYTPTDDTTFYAVSGEAVTITYVINGDSSNTQIVARSTPTELRAFEDMGIDPPDSTKYFIYWSDLKNIYNDRQTVSLTGDIVLTAQWREAEEPAPAAPYQVTVSKHLVNYGKELLNGHSGELSGIDTSMEYYYNGNWQNFTRTPVQGGIAKPYDFEIRYAEKTSPQTPPSKSVIRPIYSFVSEASDPEDKSTLLEEVYTYDVNIYSVRPSGEKTVVVDASTEEGRALQDVLSMEDIYFLLDYPDGITQNSNKLTLTHDGKTVEIEQLSEGILGKANDFWNPEFTLTVEDKLYGLVELGNKTPKAGDTITATVSYTNLVGKPVYRWLRDGVPCTEYSTSNSYTLTGADLMHTLSCEVKSASTPPTPDGTIVSEQTSMVVIESHESYMSESGTTSTFVGYFDGVTDDMEYSLNDGISFRPVSEAGILDTDNHVLYVNTPGVYAFRYRNETDPEYWETIDNEIEGWYIVGYNISTSFSPDSGSGTVTFRNGTTTLSSSSRITDSSGRIIIQGDGTNRWRVRMGSNTNINMVVRPSGSSSSSSSSSIPNTTTAHVSLNDGEYMTFTGERTISVEPVNQNKIYTIVFNRSSSSPITDAVVVPLDEEHFPDPALRSTLSSYRYDRNYDGNLSEAEIAEITTFSCSNYDIASLKGIEYFDKLKVLYCSGNFLNELDLSACKSLTSVYCNNNYLTELKLDGCASLSLLNCADNMLTELDLSACPNLTTLDCSGNSLTALSLDENTALSSLMCQNNAISSLDLSDCGKLKTLTCSDNVLRTLVLGENDVLSSLNCSNNRLTALDLSECAALKSLYCGNNSVTVVSLPIGMTRINSGAFRDCVSLRSIVIPEGVTIISSEAFRGCESLASVTIPVSVARIGGNAFAGCGNLREIVYDGTEGQWQQINIAPGNEALGKNSGSPIGYDSAPDFTVPASLTTIEEEAFVGGAFFFVKLPDGIESIGPRAFAECPRLAFIRFSAQNVDIDATAFDGVTGLTFLGTPGGSVEAYAAAHGFTFQAE